MNSNGMHQYQSLDYFQPLLIGYHHTLFVATRLLDEVHHLQETGSSTTEVMGYSRQK